MKYTLFFEFAAMVVEVSLRATPCKRLFLGLRVENVCWMFDQKLCHLLVRDEEVFVCGVRIFGVSEPEEEVCKVDARCYRWVGGYVCARCFGDGYFGRPFWYAWHAEDV
jgi:hypothetical protein